MEHIEMDGINILVTGAKGLLGGAFIAFSKYNRIHGLTYNDLDICDLSATFTVINKLKPDVIIHCAAKTNLEWCEKNRDEAYAVNVQGTVNLLEAAKSISSKFVFISSTGVYGDHKSSAYTEDDDVIPTTWHHQTKLAAELLVISSGLPYLVIRAGWLYGSYNYKTDFVLNRIREAQDSPLMHSNISQIGNPTLTKDLVKQVSLLLKLNTVGIFNCVNSGVGISRFEYTKKIISSIGSTVIVEPVQERYFNRVAPVSKNESAVNTKLVSQGINLMPSWNLALEGYIEDILPIHGFM